MTASCHHEAWLRASDLQPWSSPSPLLVICENIFSYCFCCLWLECPADTRVLAGSMHLLLPPSVQDLLPVNGHSFWENRSMAQIAKRDLAPNRKCQRGKETEQAGGWLSCSCVKALRTLGGGAAYRCVKVSSLWDSGKEEE
jgi:hypothetical protein